MEMVCLQSRDIAELRVFKQGIVEGMRGIDYVGVRIFAYWNMPLDIFD
jgi:hypothetical protein